MFFLFAPFQPSFGLAFWSVVIFLVFWYFIGKFAFGPIARALEKREQDIQGALDEAKKAREEMNQLKAENEKILAEAREERSMILKEAKDSKTAIINEARDKAKEEAGRIVAQAKVEIENQKKAALDEVKREVGLLAMDIAEKVIKRELKSQQEHIKYVDDLVKQLNV